MKTPITGSLLKNRKVLFFAFSLVFLALFYYFNVFSPTANSINPFKRTGTNTESVENSQASDSAKVSIPLPSFDKIKSVIGELRNFIDGI